MAHQVRNPARTVGQVRQAVGPRFQQHQPERIGPARQREHVQRGKEIALLLLAQRSEPTEARGEGVRLPESAEARHLRPGEDNGEAMALPP